MKFKAWDITRNREIKDFAISSDGNIICVSNILGYDGLFNAKSVLISGSGIFDVNNNEIFGHHIIKMLCHPDIKKCQKNATVKLIMGTWYYFPIGKNETTKGRLFELSKRCKIIGNTYKTAQNLQSIR